MKRHKTQWTACLTMCMAALLLAGQLSGCSSKKDGKDPETESTLYPDTVVTDGITEPATNPVTKPETDPATESETDPETESETEGETYRDEVQQGPFDTTTDLQIPDYGGIDMPTKDAVQEIHFQGFGEGVPNFPVYWGEAYYEDGALIFRADQGGSTVFPAQSQAESTTAYHLTVKSQKTEASAPWNTLYFLMRLSGGHQDATQHKAVCLALRSNEIGLRTGNWASTSYMEIPVSFDEGLPLTIVDDPVKNVITITARVPDENGKDKDLLLATVRINGCDISLCPGDSMEPAVKDTVDEPVPANGYTSMWSHHPNCPVEIRDISMTAPVKVMDPDGDNNGSKPTHRDVLSDTWVGADALHRLVEEKQVAPNDRKVGIFYFLWHDHRPDQPIYDHNKSYLNGGTDELWKTMAEGPLGFAHYWAEPYFGYYCSNDEWVLRKHATQLTDAGVDFVYFDATNGLLYENSVETLLSTWAKMRKEGLKTPDVCWLTRISDQVEFNTLWDKYYSTGKYEDLWFRWNEKPLLMIADNDSSNTIRLTDEQKDFFEIRYSWALTKGQGWYDSRNGVDCWAWADMYPQNLGFTRNEKGGKVPEQMNVMCGFWANGSFGTNAGRSWTRKNGIPKTDQPWDFGYGLMNTTSGLGLAFQEGFDHAIEKNPPLLMVTGWNEWWAGRWEGSPAVGQTICNEYVVTNNPKDKEFHYFVDNFNPEYSRDIEAMKGGFVDNYYYQLSQNIRAYKGARLVESAFGQGAIDLNGSEGQWYSVGPEYRDTAFDTAHRNHPSAVGKLTYKNDTGRNDFVTAKVSQDSHSLYFFVECHKDIVKDDGANWMNLFIKADGDETTGWYGFDYILNRSRDGQTVSVEKFTSTDGKNEWTTEKIGTADYTVKGKILQIKVDKALLNVQKTFDFKWADNSVKDGDIMQFVDLGDTAPNDRFCYRYTTEKQAPATMPAGLPEKAVVLKVNGYNAFVNGEEVRLVDNNTNGVTLASGYDVWLPVSFLKSALNIEAKGETINHYGIGYVKATDLIKDAGLVMTVSPDGLIVIASQTVTDTTVLDVLYRTLH